MNNEVASLLTMFRNKNAEKVFRLLRNDHLFFYLSGLNRFVIFLFFLTGLLDGIRMNETADRIFLIYIAYSCLVLLIYLIKPIPKLNQVCLLADLLFVIFSIHNNGRMQNPMVYLVATTLATGSFSYGLNYGIFSGIVAFITYLSLNGVAFYSVFHGVVFLAIAIVSGFVGEVFNYIKNEWTKNIETASSTFKERLLEKDRNHNLKALQLAVKALDLRDNYTYEHSEGVALWCSEICDELLVDADFKDSVVSAAKLHDVGKIGVADSILNKRGRLSPEELEVIMLHPVLGSRLVQNHDALASLELMVYHHHERYDGKGYPSGLAGEEIPLGARIIALADSFNAMTTDRPYRRAMDVSKAVQEIVNNSGSQFDPEVVRAFLRALKKNVDLSMVS